MKKVKNLKIGDRCYIVNDYGGVIKLDVAEISTSLKGDLYKIKFRAYNNEIPEIITRTTNVDTPIINTSDGEIYLNTSHVIHDLTELSESIAQQIKYVLEDNYEICRRNDSQRN